MTYGRVVYKILFFLIVLGALMMAVDSLGVARGLGMIVSGAACVILLLFAFRRLVLTAKAVTMSASGDRAEPDPLPFVTVFVPAHNEQAVIAANLDALAKSSYPQDLFEVVVIDDACSDDTGSIAQTFSDRFTGFHLLCRDAATGGKGKPAALNAALEKWPNQDICYFLDADSTVHPDALMQAAISLANPDVDAVTGRLEPKNPYDSAPSFYTAVEAWVHQLCTLLPASRMGLTCAVLGSNWAIRRKTLDRFGLDESALLEDTDLSVAVNAAGGAIEFNPKMVAGYEVPPNLSEYVKQHLGWARGFARIGKKRSQSLVTGSGGIIKKIDGLIYSWGYLDRPVFLIYLIMLGGNTRYELFVAPAWIAAVVLWLPVLQMLVALKRARRPMGDYFRLVGVVPMYAVDLLVSAVAIATAFGRRAPLWYKTARRDDSSSGKYMKQSGKNDG